MSSCISNKYGTEKSAGLNLRGEHNKWRATPFKMPFGHGVAYVATIALGKAYDNKQRMIKPGKLMMKGLIVSMLVLSGCSADTSSEPEATRSESEEASNRNEVGEDESGAGALDAGDDEESSEAGRESESEAGSEIESADGGETETAFSSLR